MPVHHSAVVDPAADVHPTAWIGPLAVVEADVTIGAECHLGPGAAVLQYTTLGRGCRVHARAVVGDLPQDRKFRGEATYCTIGEYTTIREGATIHRGTAERSSTTIGANCLLMTNSHVAHNCRLGDGVTLVSGALLGGHVQVDNGAIVSGNAAVHQFVRIGELALVGILARIVQDVPPFCVTDSEGLVVGENRVGMKRAGLTLAEREEVKAAYQAIHRSGVGRNTAIEYLTGAVKTPAGLRLLDFFLADTARGTGIRAFKPDRAA